MRNRLARVTLALVTAAASVAGFSSVASAQGAEVQGFVVDFTTQGAAAGTVNSGYTLLKGNSELDFVMFGQDFTPDTFQDITLHKGTCATPGAVVDTFEIDPALRVSPALDPSPKTAPTASPPVQGTAGTLRYSQGSTITMLATPDDIPTFAANYRVIIRQRGAPATDYLCGTPGSMEVVGSGSVVGDEYPFVFKELNGSGAAASGTVTVIGNIASFNISYTGLDQVISQHFQVLRQTVGGTVECPAGDTAAEADMGGIKSVALTGAPRSLLPVEALTAAGFFVSPGSTGGNLSYSGKVSLTQAQSDDFENSIVVIHGFDVNDSGTSDGGPSPVPGSAPLTAEETAVAGCGQFKTSAPEAPAAPTASSTADEVTVTWEAPFNGGEPITGYTVTLNPGAIQTTVTGTTATFTGVADNTYTATVVATNAVGTSAASPASNPVVVDSSGLLPGPPTAVNARAVGKKLIISWTAPTNPGGSAITGYTVTLAPGGATKTVSATNATFDPLPVDTYIATVVANNSTGSSTGATSNPGIVRDCQDGDVDSDWDARVVTAANGSLFRLYCGYFLRYPDDSGWTYWSGIQADGADLILISDQFALSQEFLNTYGSLNNDQFVRLLYANVLLREVDTEGYNYWKGFLDRGELSQGGTMRWVAEGKEFQNVTGTP